MGQMTLESTAPRTGQLLTGASNRRASIACMIITHLPVKEELRRRPDLRRKPVIVTARSEKGPIVLDRSPEAVGVLAGMPLSEALSRCEGTALIEADEVHYRDVFDGVVAGLLQRSPLVERADPDCAYVDIQGLETVYGDEAGTISALLRAAPEELHPRIGLAESKFTAYVAAVMSQPGGATKAPEDAAGFLKDLPVDFLPLSWESKSRLRRFGLLTMGQVAALSVGSLQAQFGLEGKTAWELSNGIDSSWLTPVGQEEEVSEYAAFPSPTVTLRTIVPVVDMLLGKTLAHPAVRGRYVRGVTMESKVLHKPTWTRNFTFKSPVNNRGRALAVLKSGLEASDIPGPLEDMRLTLSGVTGESGTQASLFAGIRKQEQLREMMRHLEMRLRSQPPIYKVMELEPWSRIPERRSALVRFEP